MPVPSGSSVGALVVTPAPVVVVVASAGSVLAAAELVAVSEASADVVAAAVPFGEGATVGLPLSRSDVVVAMTSSVVEVAPAVALESPISEASATTVVSGAAAVVVDSPLPHAAITKAAATTAPNEPGGRRARHRLCGEPGAFDATPRSAPTVARSCVGPPCTVRHHRGLPGTLRTPLAIHLVVGSTN